MSHFAETCLALTKKRRSLISFIQTLSGKLRTILRKQHSWFVYLDFNSPVFNLCFIFQGYSGHFSNPICEIFLDLVHPFSVSSLTFLLYKNGKKQQFFTFPCVLLVSYILIRRQLAFFRVKCGRSSFSVIIFLFKSDTADCAAVYKKGNSL